MDKKSELSDEDDRACAAGFIGLFIGTSGATIAWGLGGMLVFLGAAIVATSLADLGSRK